MSVSGPQNLSRRGFLGAAARGTATAAFSGAVLGINQSASAAYPKSYLNVPWMTQYLGQQPKNLITHCCGPTCTVMIKAYWMGIIPNQDNLWEALRWLDMAYGHKSAYYATQESQTTSIADLNTKDFAWGTNEVGQLLATHYGLHYKKYRGNNVPYTNSQSNLGNLLILIAQGFPCIVGCSVASGKLGTLGEPHFAVAIGFDGTNVILQNPGTANPSNGSKGLNEKMSLKAFDDSWATNNRIYAPAAPSYLL